MNKTVFLLIVASLAGAASAQNFTDGFENATYATGSAGGTVTSAVTWTAVNNSSPIGVNSWFAGTNTARTFAPRTGSGYAAANSNNGGGTATIDDYLMTPTLSLRNGETFSFFTRSPSTAFADRLYVKLSTAGSSIAVSDVATTLRSINPNLSTTAGAAYPTDWTQYTVTLSGLSGITSGRLAFDYNVTNGGPNGANSNYIGIDDVAYVQAVPEPGTVAAFGLGALAFVRRRKHA